jgi:FdrA protein
MVTTQGEAKRFPEFTDRTQGPRGAVGIVSASTTGAQELLCLLARAEVGVSRALVGQAAPAPGGEVAALEAGLRSLQADATIEIIVLVSDKLPAEAAGPILDLVRASDKPAVVCFMGNQPRLAWRAGAIPATRLDEAAMRAIAWVRGWDQALVSSNLEEEGDQLSRLAASLRTRIGPGRREVRGVVAGSILRHEAQIVISATTGTPFPAGLLHIARTPASRRRHLRAALADPVVAVVLLDLWLAGSPGSDPAGVVADLVREAREAGSLPLIVAYVCDTDCDLERLAAQEAALHSLGLVVAASSAAAARLAALVAHEIE